MTADVFSLQGRRRPPTFEFGDRLRVIRRDLGLGQVEFADFLGVGRQAFSAWEAGRTKPRDMAALVELLEEKTGVHRNWFLGWPVPDDNDGGPTNDGGRSRDRTGDLPGGNTVIPLLAVA